MRKNKRVFFSAKKGETTETHLFHVKLDGTDLKRLTKEPGSHRARMSPGGSYCGQKRAHSNRHYVDFWFKHFLNH